jgi:L-lactate dehydrogenase complex protein LldG
MEGARDTVLAGIRRALGIATQDDRTGTVERRLADHPRGPRVARTEGSEATQRALFIAKVEEAAATIAELRSLDEVPAAIADYLRARNLPPMLRIAPDPSLEGLPWSNAPMLTVTSGASDGKDPVSLTGCAAGIAETGTLMLVSGADNPTGLAFLPETHVVIVRRSQLVGGLEDAWDRLRAARGPGGGETWPRAVNFITGPSRSGDIEQTLQMGAHGPKQLHVLLVDG